MAYTVLDLTKTETKTPYYTLQVEAAQTMSAALDEIRALREDPGFGWPIDEETDPLKTGIIGDPSPHWDSPSITTTRGIIASKRTSANPDFAALMVRYFMDLRLREGDSVAVNFSGSFPALNIATLSAIEVMGLNPVIASSLGASSYGANNPDFTWVDMERHLFEAGIFSHRSRWVSLGGDNDQLLEEDDDTFKDALRAKYADGEVVFIDEDDLDRNIVDRYRGYHEEAVRIRAFVNVGGNQVAFGRHRHSYPNGLTRRLSVTVVDGSGLIERFLRDDIPVIHLLNIPDLARRHGMEVDPQTAFVIGEGDHYVTAKHSAVGTSLTLATLAVAVVTERAIRHIHTKRKKDSE